MSLLPRTTDDGRLCVVNCGLPGEQCDCYRRMVHETWAGRPLPADFRKVWDDNAQEMYQP